MVKTQKKGRRETKRKHQRTGGLSTGAGLFTFFEDSSMGIKIKPITNVVFALILIGMVMSAHIGIFDWMF